MIPARRLLACCLAASLAACVQATPPASPAMPATPDRPASPVTPPAGGNAARADEADAVRWTIAAARMPCTGVGPTSCLQYRDAAGGPWKNHHGPIEGFEFQPGVEVDLLVRFVTVPRPPADGAARRVVLVREIDRRPAMTPTAVPPALAGSSWRLVAPADATAPAEARAVPTLSFDAGGRASGSAGVNRFGAGLVADARSLRFTGAFTTRMAGPPDAMAHEAAYLGRLQQVAAWRIAQDRLELLDAGGALLLQFERAPRPGAS